MKHFLWLLGACLFLHASCVGAETRLEVDGAACDHLVNYIEPPGVEYKPGVDVYGNPVAPADLNGGSTIKLPTKFTIPITDYLYTKLANSAGTPPATSSGATATPSTTSSGGAVPNNIISPALTVGVVTYDIDSGALDFNGQPLNGDPDGALAQLCRKARAGQ